MYFLIGHRGVGKTTLATSVPGGMDLDAEILKTHDIADFFKKGKEAKFRELEREVLKNLLEQESAPVISLGAGFELEKFNFPQEAKFIWVQRRSDETGRIFLDRPRLDSDKDHLEEFEGRKKKRDKLYSKHSDFSIDLEEGAEDFSLLTELVEKGRLGKAPHGFYTLKKLAELGFVSSPIELRTDFFDEENIREILERRRGLKDLVALRKPPTEKFIEYLLSRDDILVDVPLEYTSCDYFELFKGPNFFVSEHDFISVEEIASFNEKGVHIKWSPEVESFEDLIEYHNMVKDMDLSFLPRSVGSLAGRWNWYRQITYFRNKITFFRYGLNDYIDQPSFCEVSSLSDKEGLSGAVIGGDVSLSHSPAFHKKFFKDHFGGTYVRVSLYQDEFLQENLSFLNSLGVSFFSVTSPFKKELGKYSKDLEVANTLSTRGVWSVEDTDKASILYLKEELKNKKSVLVWGAGAVGTSVYKTLEDKARLQSIRDYEEGALEGEDFDALVWSAGSECILRPKLQNHPKVIYDIEYKEHSQAKAVALSWGSKYISGKDFFRVQAKAQQDFWLKFKKEEL
ncbi:MAG: shikimate kinase [Bdellovibrionales bacterium]